MVPYAYGATIWWNAIRQLWIFNHPKQTWVHLLETSTTKMTTFKAMRIAMSMCLQQFLPLQFLQFKLALAQIGTYVKVVIETWHQDKRQHQVQELLHCSLNYLVPEKNHHNRRNSRKRVLLIVTVSTKQTPKLKQQPTKITIPSKNNPFILRKENNCVLAVNYKNTLLR